MTASFYAKSFRYDTRLLTRRGHGVLMKHLYKTLGDIHKRETIKKHFKIVPETFTTSGGYKYERRSRPWRKIKIRLKGHQKPLVFSGRLQKAVVLGSKIAATQRKFSFTARAPFPLKKKRSEELEVISARETREYSRRLGRLYPIEATKFQEHKRLRIRS